MKAHAVAALKAQFPLSMLLDVADLARSTFYYHQARMGRPDPYHRLKDAIRRAFTDAKRRYGHRRVHALLRRDGWKVAKKTVLKLMRDMGLACHVRKRRPNWLACKGLSNKTAPNLLNREFTAAAPNQKWVTDVTEFGVGGQKVYLSPVIDLFDRSVISYSLSKSPNLTLTTSALREAIATLPSGARPLVHSDQGFQYQHAHWRRLLTEHGLTQSMSRRGNCLDNAVAENFFGHLKSEIFQHEHAHTTNHLITAIQEYIDWYNTERIHTRLGNVSPTDYRSQTLAV